MTKYRIAEIVCVCLAVVFIVVSFPKEIKTDKTASDISSEILPMMKDETLIERDSSFVREKFGIDSSSYSSFTYYSSDDVMNVNELFIAVFSEKVPVSFADGFKSYSEDRFNLYNGYVPEQARFLENCAILTEGNVFLFCVGENSVEISAFLAECM